MRYVFDSFRLIFARIRLSLHVLALGFPAVDDVLNPVLHQFYSSSSSSSHSSSVPKVPNLSSQEAIHSCFGFCVLW